MKRIKEIKIIKKGKDVRRWLLKKYIMKVKCNKKSKNTVTAKVVFLPSVYLRPHCGSCDVLVAPSRSGDACLTGTRSDWPSGTPSPTNLFNTEHKIKQKRANRDGKGEKAFDAQSNMRGERSPLNASISVVRGDSVGRDTRTTIGCVAPVSPFPLSLVKLIIECTNRELSPCAALHILEFIRCPFHQRKQSPADEYSKTSNPSCSVTSLLHSLNFPLQRQSPNRLHEVARYPDIQIIGYPDAHPHDQSLRPPHHAPSSPVELPALTATKMLILFQPQ